jgi:carbamoyltransferase
MANEEWVLGFGGSDHDFSAALLHGNDIAVAVERERLSRVKYGIPAWYEDPLRMCVDHCLGAAGLQPGDVARAVSSDFLPYRTLDAWSMQTFGHHECHAASAVMLLPPGCRARVLVYDGAGSLGRALDDGRRTEYETFSFYEFADGELMRLGGTHGERYIEHLHPLDGGTRSAGQLYELVTCLVGFERHEAGKTMGLAAWGRPRFVDDLMQHVRLGDDLGDVLAIDPFDEALQATLASHLRAHGNAFSIRADLAASVQQVFTLILRHCYELVADGDFDVFALAGGCALNTVANGALAAALPAGRRLLVPPHAGDAGIALGSLWLDRRRRSAEPFQLTIRGRPLMPWIARPGRCYGAERIRRAAGSVLDRAAEDPAVDGPEPLARVIADGAVVGVLNGGSEIGPRALGGRSVLADPRGAAAKERINRRIKHREPFRPLAPMVLAERFDEYFRPAAAADPFMLIVAEATPKCRRVAPAVVHVDGTSRVQVIGPQDDHFLVRLLRAFEAETGVPVLLNTSFNRRGEPIVETPEDAVAAFLDMGLDGLWMDGVFLYRPG